MWSTMKKIIKVPFKKQVIDFSCFPAAVNAVLRFYGDEIDERSLYRKSIIKGHGKGSFDVKISQVLIKKGYDVTTFWNGFMEGSGLGKGAIRIYKKEYKKALKKGMVHKRNATISLIKKFIDKGIPVLTEVSAGKFYGTKAWWTHMIIVVGYDSKNFYVHDPDKYVGKKFKKITISKFRKCWEQISPLGVGRSMFVIVPKNGKLKLPK